MQIRLYNSSDKQSWDSYVLNHPASTHCHLSGWKDVIENVYRHKGYYILAEEDSKIKGVLPFFHMRSLLFGNYLVSMPFLNYGGIIADDEKTEAALLSEAVRVGRSLKVSRAELRHLKPVSSLNAGNPIDGSHPARPLSYITRTHKARMLLKLPGAKEELLKSFKAKLRSQISRPQKEGMTAIIGGIDLIEPFYKVFSINMRDLGSPVHCKKLFKQICIEFPQQVKIGVVHYQKIPVAAGLIFCFRDTVEIPWASSLKQFNKFSPNMFLYWSLLEYACDERFKYFDFGRSTPEEGTYKFKGQWGAKPLLLYWQNIVFKGHPISENDSHKTKFGRAIEYWKKLPVSVSNVIGPLIRKHISL